MLSINRLLSLRSTRRCSASAVPPLFLLVLTFSVVTSPAQQPSSGPAAEARLGKTEAAIGERVPLQVTIPSVNVELPDPDIYVDGLVIRFAGKQTRIESVNFNSTFSTQLTWIVIPQRAGDFEIPALSFVADGRRVTTGPLKLRVSPGGMPGGPAPVAPPSSPSGPAQPPGQNNDFLAEMRLPSGRNEFFVGELIPVDIVFGADARIQASLRNPPEIQQGDFSTQKLSDPVQTSEERNGRTYSALIFRTAIAPVKTGQITLPRVDLPLVVITPSPARSRPPIGRLIDPFDPAIDQFFEDFFNDDPFARLRSVPREMTLSTNPSTITVKPLPQTGRPATFDGAVGSFSMTATASPAAPAVGDPVQIKVQISGTGNFDTVTAPKLDGLKGWRIYPATASFAPSNAINTSGTKTFEIVLVPGADATPIDAIEFSFFNPETAQYQTIRSAPLGIRPQTKSAAQAHLTPTPQPDLPSPAGNPSPEPATPPPPPGRDPADPTPTPRQALEDDLFHIQTERPDPPRSLVPPWESGTFLRTNLAILLLFAGAALARWLIGTFRSPESRKRRAFALQHAKLVATLKSRASTERDLLAAAAELIEVHRQPVDAAERSWILSQRDRLLYAGGVTGLEPEPLRQRLLAALHIK